MRAAILGLAALLAVGLSPARAGDIEANGSCQPVRLTLEMISQDIKATHGSAIVLKGGKADRYLDAIDLQAPADGFGAVIIYRRGDIAVVGFITVDMESVCEARMLPVTLHDKALMRANSAPA